MSWAVAPAIIQLRSELDEEFPDRAKPDGTIGDAAHSARTSDHNPDDDRLVCAVDAKRLSPALDSDALARALVASRDARIKYVISRGKMWSSYPARGYPAWAERPYSGTNAHADHVHLSVTQAGKRGRAPWAAVAALVAADRPAPPPAKRGKRMFITNAKGDNRQYLIQEGGGSHIKEQSTLDELVRGGVPRLRDKDPEWVASVIRGGRAA